MTLFTTAGGNDVALPTLSDLSKSDNKKERKSLYHHSDFDSRNYIQQLSSDDQSQQNTSTPFTKINADFFNMTNEKNSHEKQKQQGEQKQEKDDSENDEEKENKQRLKAFEQIASVEYETISFDSIGGLVDVKQRLNQVIIQPLLRPELFTGLRTPPKGILLFGPPGNGKTMIAKCIASRVQELSTKCKNKDGTKTKFVFITIHTADLISKWVGETEKQIKALFDYAASNQPSIIFIDEIDSLFQKRTEESKSNEVRVINEFLSRMDGIRSSDSTKNNIYIIGATNRPNMIDDAALRRLTLKFYVPLPDDLGRIEIAKKKLSMNNMSSETIAKHFTDENWRDFAERSKNYTGDDITKVVCQAAMIPLQKALEKHGGDITKIEETEELNEITFPMMLESLSQHKSTVKDLDEYISWGKRFGANM